MTGRFLLSSPIVIHVVRPYNSEEEYLANERRSIEPKSMLLIDQPPLPVATTVIFDVALANGNKPIRAEGRVLRSVAPDGNSPGGLLVRFTRFGASTKAFISLAVSGGSPGAPSAEVAPPPTAPPGFEAAPPASTSPASPEASGLHAKVVRPVAAPANRDALLARLRQRQAG